MNHETTAAGCCAAVMERDANTYTVPTAAAAAAGICCRYSLLAHANSSLWRYRPTEDCSLTRCISMLRLKLHYFDLLYDKLCNKSTANQKSKCFTRSLQVIEVVELEPNEGLVVSDIRSLSWVKIWSHVKHKTFAKLFYAKTFASTLQTVLAES